jgi:hypothetical protein
MAYTPLNVNVYAAAFSGAMAGLGVPDGAFIVDPTTGDYANVALVASVFSQAVDTAWGTGAANAYDVNAIANASSNIFTRGAGYPLTGAVTTQLNWTTVATALVALVRQGNTNATAIQNITFPGVGGGSNRAYGEGTPAVAGAATINIIAAVKLIAKSSGLFKAWCNFSWAALAAVDLGTLTVNVFSDAVAGVPLTLANVVAMGFGSNGVAQPGNVAVNNNGPFGYDGLAGTGIAVAGANAGYNADIKVITQGTAAVGAIIAWENIVGLAIPAAGVETPVPLGRTCLVTISLTNTVAARVTGVVSLGMFEL